MQVISFNNTVLLKRGIWLSVAALTAYAASPSMLDGGLWRRPLASLIPLCILLGFWVYFLRRTAFYRLADRVIDCIDHLEVRKGRTAELISFSSVSTAEVSSYLGVHWITIRLHKAGKLGDRIAFLPQASLWGNLPAIQRVAAQLTQRARPAEIIAGRVSPPRADSR
ncbi:MAG TPA: hypothetical protein VHY75_05690 [Steroidobacteraceae bacterium]|nr:hypothetical protein [Steroidobacteraceae bacterium]